MISDRQAVINHMRNGMRLVHYREVYQSVGAPEWGLIGSAGSMRHAVNPVVAQEILNDGTACSTPGRKPKEHENEIYVLRNNPDA